MSDYHSRIDKTGNSFSSSIIARILKILKILTIVYPFINLLTDSSDGQIFFGRFSVSMGSLNEHQKSDQFEDTENFSAGEIIISNFAPFGVRINLKVLVFQPYQDILSSFLSI